MAVQPIRSRETIQLIKKILVATSPRNHLLFVLGINAGLRISDILRLTIGDILDDKGAIAKFIEVREKKTNKCKRFAINDNVNKAIKAYLRSLDRYSYGDFLFKSREGANKPISRFQAYKILNKAATEANLKDRIGTHSLRKTFGYHAYLMGTDLSLLQDLLNHSSPSITLRYIGITQDQRDEVYVNINL